MEFGSAKAATSAPTHRRTWSATPCNVRQAGDWNRLMALAPPDELPVYDYRAWLNRVASESEPDFTIDHLTTSASVSGDTATVKLDASGKLGTNGDGGTWQVGGTCPDPRIGWIGYGSDFTGSSGDWTDSGSTMELCLAGDLGDVVPFGLYVFGSGDVAPASGSVSVDVVRVKNGRWFVSPVTTVLEALDATVQHIDERTIYTLLNLAVPELPPDGTITLNEPFTTPARSGFFSSSVFAFDGTKGQKVVGELSGNLYFASGEIVTVDGKEVDYVNFSSREQRLRLFGDAPGDGELPARGDGRRAQGRRADAVGRKGRAERTDLD